METNGAYTSCVWEMLPHEPSSPADEGSTTSMMDSLDARSRKQMATWKPPLHYNLPKHCGQVRQNWVTDTATIAAEQSQNFCNKIICVRNSFESMWTIKLVHREICPDQLKSLQEETRKSFSLAVIWRHKTQLAYLTSQVNQCEFIFVKFFGVVMLERQKYLLCYWLFF